MVHSSRPQVRIFLVMGSPMVSYTNAYPAAEKGKLLRLRPYLSGDLNVLNENKQTPLALASSNGHMQCVEALLDAKADVNALCFGGATALMIASREGYVDVVNKLLEKRADPNMTDEIQLTALHHACEHNKNHPIVAALLAGGASVQLRKSVIEHALMHSCVESVKILLAAGAPIRSSGAISTLGHAASCGSVELAKLLIEAKADVHEKAVTSALTSAIFAADDAMVKLFIDAGADVHTHDKNGRTCLHVACDLSKGLVTEVLVEEGADPDDKRFAGLQSGRFDTGKVVFRLIDSNADVSAKDIRGATPTMLAAAHDNLPVLQVLLSRGAKVDDLDLDGQSALHYAAASNALSTAESLIAAGADFNLRTRAGDTPISTAIMRSHPKMVRLLCDVRADLDISCLGGVPPLTLAQRLLAEKCGSAEVVAVLEEAGAPPWDTVMAQQSEFLWAAFIGEIYETTKLIYSASKSQRELALILASCTEYSIVGHRQVVQLLLSVGTNPSCHVAGHVPLIEASAQGTLEVVQDLVKARADVTAENYCGQTALQAAAKKKHRDVVSFLLTTANNYKK